MVQIGFCLGATAMNTFLILAAASSALVCLLHIFGGGPQVVEPLLKSEMDDVPKYLNYYCWHLVTLTLVVMTIGFTLASLNPIEVLLALLMTLLAGSFVIWSLGLALWKRQSLWDMPQWLLFLPVAAFGALGLWA